MKAVPLAEGDPTWVFPETSVSPALMASLAGSGDRLVEVAGLLPGGRAAWYGSGLEYNVYPPSGKCCLYGWAENPQVTFTVELAPPGFRAGPVGWKVTADISVDCEARYNASCGMHVMEEFAPDVYASPEEAVAAVEQATQWLLARCRAVAPADWLARDPLEPCRGHD